MCVSKKKKTKKNLFYTHTQRLWAGFDHRVVIYHLHFRAIVLQVVTQWLRLLQSGGYPYQMRPLCLQSYGTGGGRIKHQLLYALTRKHHMTFLPTAHWPELMICTYITVKGLGNTRTDEMLNEHTVSATCKNYREQLAEREV